MANSSENSPGAFGGLYNHEVIKQLRTDIATKGIIIAALVEHTGIKEEEMRAIVTDFLKRKHAEVLKQQEGG